MTKCKLMKGLLGATALTVLSTGNAFAQNEFTPAGELVSNTFTLNYEVNNTTQTEINNTATPTVFNVDRLVNVTVSSPGDTLVIADQDDVLLPFVVVNNGNDTHPYLLGFEQPTSGDDFNTATATTAPDIIFYDETADTNDDGVLSEAERLAATPQDYNTTPGSVNVPVLDADERAFVYVRQNIPAGTFADADTADIILYADTQTIDSGTGVNMVLIDTAADGDGNDADATIVENVLADIDGPATAANDADADGAHSATGSFIIEIPNVTATKAVWGLSAAPCAAIPAAYTEPTANTEYFTPNSCVEYVIEVVNDGTTDATNIDLTDILPDHLTFREAEVRGDLVFLPADLTAPAAATVCDGTATCTVALADATLDAGKSGFLVIRATID